MAVDGRADARGQAERAVAEVATLLSRAQTAAEGSPNWPACNPKVLRDLAQHG